MKKTITLFLLGMCLNGIANAFAGDVWQRVPGVPATGAAAKRTPGKQLTYRADAGALKLALTSAARTSEYRVLELPMPDGTFRSFRVQETHMLPPELAARYPELRTFNAVATDDARVVAKLDFTVYGFHAMVYDGDNTAFIDPAVDAGDDLYVVHYRRDEVRDDGHSACMTTDVSNVAATINAGTARQHRVVNGYELRTYRLALSCSHQYSQKVTGSTSPTKAQVLSKMTTTMNRVNGVYEQELSITMVFAAKEDTLIYTVSAGDPFGPYNSSASSLLTINQDMCDSLVGDANYDIGHAFSTGAGGLSSVGVVCKSGSKAQCVTGSENPSGDGFDIDYVVHEMGHEYGADHTFNNNQSIGCSGNAVVKNAYEPGSGSTIMAYAGLCSPDNVQGNSDAYFHTASIKQIQHYTTHQGDACAVKTPNSAKMPGIEPFAASYVIPSRTPFELTAPVAIDSVGGSEITYCWEQWNLGGFGLRLTNTNEVGPLFRSYKPVKERTRVFPNIKMVRNGLLSNAGVDKASGEKIPDSSRYLTFKLTVRSLKGSYGCVHVPDDTMHLDVINSGGNGFAVTSQSTAGSTFEGLSSQTITWDVAGTASAPINTANVDIYLSVDSGKSWAYTLGTFPNNGSATVTLPNPDSTVGAARFKVKGANNVFFNINSKDFRIVRNFGSSVKLYPVPAGNTLTVASDNAGPVKVAVFSVAGRLQWEGEITGTETLPVYLWARGVYIMKLIDSEGRRSIKKFVVE